MKLILLILIMTFIVPCGVSSQGINKKSLSLDEVVNHLSIQCSSAKIERLNYQNALLLFENYKKSFLPSISFNLNPINFNRSLKLLQRPEDGSYSNVEDYSNNSAFGITIKQKVGFTGGDLTIGSNLNYLKEFSPNRNSFSMTPFTIGYSQKIWGERKLNKFERDIEYKKSRIAIEEYCTAILRIQKESLSLFMEAFLSKLNKDIALKNKTATDTLLHLGKMKLENGNMTEYEYKQIELQQTNNLYELENSGNNYQQQWQKLLTFLDISHEYITIESPRFNLPLNIDIDVATLYTRKNNPFMLNQSIKQVEAKKALFTATLNAAFNGNISLNYGLNQYAETFLQAYQRPNSRQSVSIGIQIPIFQWGINKNKKQIAENIYQSTLLTINQDNKEFENEIVETVNRYNHNVKLWFLSERAFQLAQEQHQMVIKKFSLSKVSVYELIAVQQEQTTAMQRFYSAIRDVWESYFTLQQMTLYDFDKQEELINLLTINISQ